MRYAKLGNTGLKVSRVCLGTMTMGDQTDEAESIRIIDHAMEHGLTFFDSAERYMEGRSEEILGKAVKGKRHQMVLATKVRAPMGEPLSVVDLSRRHVFEAVEASLRRLQTDYIDLYQLHRFDRSTPLEETLRALDDLVHQGKILYIGCSNFAAWQLCKALWISDKHDLARFCSVQPLYNMMLRYQELETVPLCRDQGVGIIPYNPLGGGFLTGKYRRESEPGGETRFGRRSFYKDRYWTDESFDKLERAQRIGQEHGHGLVDVAIGWLLKRDVVPSVIVGATSIQQLDQSIKAADVELADEEFDALKELWPPQGPPAPVPGIRAST